MKSIKFNLEIWKSYVNKIGEMIFNDKYLISQIFQKDNTNFELFKKNYEDNMVKYNTNKRFPIPIIGKISSGKSTFLNCILQRDVLSSSSGIDTQFICILRHNKDIKSPLFYKCKLVETRIDYNYENFEYNHFEKTDDDVVEGESNILENIKKINNNLKEYEKKYKNFDERNINEYFYILELKIPLFNTHEELGEFFDLMDIPGLNEKEDFYVKIIIPKIIDKCLFSIYIFDISHFENNDTKEVYKNYSNLLNKTYNSNSIYIANKIDEITKDKNKQDDLDFYLTKFKKFLSSEYYEVYNNDNDNDNNNVKNKNKEGLNVDLRQNFFLKLNSKGIYNKINTYSNLKTYIQYTIDNIEEKNYDLVYLSTEIKKTLKKCFSIKDEELENIINDTIDDNYKEYYDKNEFESVSKIIINNNLSSDFEENDIFQKIKYIIDKKPKLRLPIQELDEIYNTILCSMEKSLNNFFDWKKVEDLFEIFKDSINKTFEENEKKKYIQICDKLLYSFKKEIEWKTELKKLEKWNIDIIAPLKIIIDFLINIDSSSESLKRLKGDFESLTYFIYNYRKIRIPVLGGYSTGKSSFLNNLIGKDILPVDILRCTKRGIIIRHTNNKCPQLFLTKFKEVKNPNYWYFEDEKNAICEGYEQIKKNY